MATTVNWALALYGRNRYEVVYCEDTQEYWLDKGNRNISDLSSDYMVTFYDNFKDAYDHFNMLNVEIEQEKEERAYREGRRYEIVIISKRKARRLLKEGKSVPSKYTI